MTPLLVCDICRAIWGKSLEVKSMGSGGPCCVCEAERPCAGPVTAEEQGAMLESRASGRSGR